MKKLLLNALGTITLMTLFTGCLNLQLGSGTTNRPQEPTVGQQLIDLQRAKDTGAITDAQYQEQKRKILGEK